MDYLALMLVAVSLAMDAFAVSIGNGMTMRGAGVRHALAFGLMFGGLQFLMPIAGYLLGSSFSASIGGIGPWVAFALLVLIGGKMLSESFRAPGEGPTAAGTEPPSLGRLFLLGIATSIDALAVGVSIALTGWNIWVSALVIGAVAFAFSFFGVVAGKKIGARFQRNASRLGGAILIGIGIKILVEHLLS
ncbi:MAG: manganese efflux pump MntP family protein [Eggerthellaceae bacterium]|nr:manganese efflux pump MntP family protein [Eggerthellaceae bacterium]